MDAAYFEDARKAGRIAAEALAYGSSLVVPGASYHEVYGKIVAFIVQRGGIPAFPPQLSFNETAAHFLASPSQDIVLSNELVKLDVGVAVNGVIGDNAMTIDLSGKHDALVAASREAVETIAASLHVGMTLGEVGERIERVITAKGFLPIRNLSGHGLGKFQIHCAPTVPNYANNDPMEIIPGMHFACEPFATTGGGLIGEVGEAHVFSIAGEGAVRDADAKKLLRYIKGRFDTLPFGSLDLQDAGIPPFKVRVCLHQLVRSGVLHAYPPLVETMRGMVSQAEHTFLVLPDGTIECTTSLLFV